MIILASINWPGLLVAAAAFAIACLLVLVGSFVSERIDRGYVPEKQGSVLPEGYITTPETQRASGTGRRKSAHKPRLHRAARWRKLFATPGCAMVCTCCDSMRDGRGCRCSGIVSSRSMYLCTNCSKCPTHCECGR